MHILANINYKRYKNTFLTIISLLIVASLMFLLIVTIKNGSKQIVENFNKKDVSLREIEVTSFQDGKYSEIAQSTMELISKIPHVDGVSARGEIELKESYFIVDNHQHKVPFYNYIGVTYPKFNVFSNAMKDYAMTNGGNHMLAGKEFIENDNDILIDETMLLALGYKDFNIAIGKEVLCINDSSNKRVSLRIVGVYSYRMGAMAGIDEEEISGESLHKIFLEGHHQMPFIVSSKISCEILELEPATSKFKFKELFASVDDVGNVAGVYESIDALTDNFMFSNVAEASNNAKKMEMLEKILNFFVVATLFSCFLVLINTIIMKIEKQKNFAKMLRSLGYSNKKIVALYLIDFTRIFIYAFVVYTILAFSICILVEAAMKNLYLPLVENLKNVFFLNPIVYLIYSATLFFAYEIISLLIIMAYNFRIERRLTK